jgi:hypothetical protein
MRHVGHMGKQGTVTTFSLETIKRMNWKNLVEYAPLITLTGARGSVVG